MVQIIWSSNVLSYIHRIEGTPLHAWAGYVFVHTESQILVQHIHEWVRTDTIYFKINNESILTARDRLPTDNNSCIEALYKDNQNRKTSINDRSTGHHTSREWSKVAVWLDCCKGEDKISTTSVCTWKLKQKIIYFPEWNWGTQQPDTGHWQIWVMQNQPSLVE